MQYLKPNNGMDFFVIISSFFYSLTIHSSRYIQSIESLNANDIYRHPHIQNENAINKIDLNE